MHEPVLLIGYMVAVVLTTTFLVGPSGGFGGRGIARLRWPLARVLASAVLMLPAVAVYELPGLVYLPVILN